MEVDFDGRNIPLCFLSTETISQSIYPYALTAQKYSKWVHRCTPCKRPLLQNFNPTRAIIHASLSTKLNSVELNLGSDGFRFHYGDGGRTEQPAQMVRRKQLQECQHIHNLPRHTNFCASDKKHLVQLTEKDNLEQYRTKQYWRRAQD